MNKIIHLFQNVGMRAFAALLKGCEIHSITCHYSHLHT